MSDSLTWSVSLLVVVAIVVPYLLSFRKQRKVGRARLAEAKRLGTDRPVAQFPFIDAMRCIGCNSCVEACPEGDVLSVVGGTARVVNGLRCIGHGRCEIACPVGAIEVGLGDVKSREDIPLLDDFQQSLSVPGLFVAGELGGLALVKNAIGQSKTAVDRIARLAPAARRNGGGDVFDLVIVGSGPAGLAAAAAARQQGLSHLILEQEQNLGGTVLHYPRRKLVLVQAIEMPILGRIKENEYEKEHLLGLLQGLVEKAPLTVRFGEKVLDVQREGGLFSLRSTSGVTLARFVLLALGRRGTPRKLGVPGEELAKVMYRLVDAESYQNQRILVVGGGDSAAEAALGLARQRGNRVALSYRREKLVRIKKKNEDRITQLLANKRIEGLFCSDVERITPASVFVKTARGVHELPNDYVFVFAGGEPPFELLKKAGVRFGGNAAAAEGSTLPTPRGRGPLARP
jgi:thioredoxin reductase/NAD-dependent dihydropyrimidine dehydrogenase PreA subunit